MLGAQCVRYNECRVDPLPYLPGYEITVVCRSILTDSLSYWHWRNTSSQAKPSLLGMFLTLAHASRQACRRQGIIR